MNKFESSVADFQKAVERLTEILREEKTDIVRDSAIKRFELAFDLAWKTVKAFLEDNHSIFCASPQNCFREAFRMGIIDYDDFWLEIAKLRNRTVHAYDEVMADEIYEALPKVLTFFQKLILSINKQPDSKSV